MSGQNPAQTYHDYLAPSIFVPLSAFVLERARPAPGERALDVACGTGVVTRQLAERIGPSGRVVGLDINPDMLAVARAQPAPDGAAIEWKEGSGTAMDLPAGAFDLVTCQQGLQFFPDRPAGAREMRRVLDPARGRAVIACWHALDKQTMFRSVFESEARYLKVPAGELATPFSFGDADVLRRTLRDAGFGQIDIQDHTVEARFPMPDKFIKMSVMAAASVMPRFAELDANAIVDHVSRDVGRDVERFRDGEYLKFPAPTLVAVARP